MDLSGCRFRATALIAKIDCDSSLTNALFLKIMSYTMTSNKETITLTENAANEIKMLAKEDAEKGQHLRLGVEEGGCSGHEYAMGFDFLQEGDIQVETLGIKIIIDPTSFEHLKGIEIDFDDGIDGKGFSFDNPNAKRTCGCGKSFK